MMGFQSTIAWYNQHAKEYAKATAQLDSPDEIVQFTKLLPNQATVLDAGCGAGRDANLLSDKGVTVTGLDLSSELINIAREAFPQVEFIVGNLLSLPFLQSEFDGIWSHASLVHLETLEDVKNALLEFYRVMKQKGILHLLVKAQSGAVKTAVVTDILSGHDRFFQYFTGEEIQELLEQSGFELLTLEQYNERDKRPKGRGEVEWILALARKK